MKIAKTEPEMHEQKLGRLRVAAFHFYYTYFVSHIQELPELFCSDQAHQISCGLDSRPHPLHPLSQARSKNGIFQRDISML